MTSITYPGHSGTLSSQSLPHRSRRRQLVLRKARQEASPEPSLRMAAPILLFLLGLALMRLGAAEIGTSAAPTISEMVGD